MKLLTKSGIFTPYEHEYESLSHLEVYRLSEDEMHEIEEQTMPPYKIMEFLDLDTPHYFVEPGVWYTRRHFVAYDETSGLLIIEVRESLNI